ncbi:succinyldiaminopimelate transaminase [Chromatiales bacterium (ex Bugula neritina AB1)]|nr:succinyldiaminopimelate transaminase [Chromatiales bacterium (ex Bugula neritina AB1)]
MNPFLNKLKPYPFERLNALYSDLLPPDSVPAINLSIGEPKHQPPDFVLDVLAKSLHRVAKYPPTAGSPAFRRAIARWLGNRYQLSDTAVDPDQHVLPVNGTREALFAIAQCLFDSSGKRRHILMPNPFYQIYEGAALLAGAEPWYYDTPSDTAYQPDFDSVPMSVWQQCQLLYLCTPGNPAGAVLSEGTLRQVIQLAERHNFIVVSDECYSEIYPNEQNKPCGLLQAAASMGNTGFKRCIVLNSLSKRSNLPGLRSGFVAGDNEIIRQFLLYRTYHGCAMPVHTDAASIAAWDDEKHVVANRSLYREKYAAVLEILAEPLNLQQPDAGFFLWPKLPISDTEFTQSLYTQHNVRVLPGSYLSRASNLNINPGDNHIRLALVAPLDECLQASTRIVECLEQCNQSPQ